jgi:hypothetical protein
MEYWKKPEVLLSAVIVILALWPNLIGELASQIVIVVAAALILVRTLRNYCGCYCGCGCCSIYKSEKKKVRKK